MRHYGFLFIEVAFIVVVAIDIVFNFFFVFDVQKKSVLYEFLKLVNYMTPHNVGGGSRWIVSEVLLYGC